MKRETYQRKEPVVQMRDKYPYKNSPHSLTLDSEIRRIADERGELIENTVAKLSELAGISTRQINNYRAGVSDIPASLIAVFCKQFRANSLAKSILLQCDETEEMEGFDLVVLANQSAQEMLGLHSHFLEAVEDGVIDGFEYHESKRRTANVISMANRLDQVVEDAYIRRAA